MIIITKKGDAVLYQQQFDDSKNLNAVITHMMQQPTGTEMVTTISNNGHNMVFSNGPVEIEALVRKANGIVSRDRPAAKAPTA